MKSPTEAQVRVHKEVTAVPFQNIAELSIRTLKINKYGDRIFIIIVTDDGSVT